ncbi:MAG: hypothetical protein K2Q09_09150 [Phycisphaerales bacterium]|nr:hypothetical protein [Phycisphaerales bacterium]
MNHRAFTLVELGAALSVAGMAVALGAAAARGPRDRANQVKDATQVRVITQAMIIFATGNKDAYPLPSALDRNNDTVKDQGRAKDTTANIFSILIFNSSISPEIAVSPVETNAKIREHKTYDNGAPKAAVRPNNALWDPAFSADFTSEKGGNFSYAHLEPSGAAIGADAGRANRWSNTFNAEEAVLCNRGPEMTSVAYADLPRGMKQKHEPDPAKPTYGNPASNTFSFYKGLQQRPGTWWSGNVAYNDNHVDFIGDYLSPGQPVVSGARYLNSKESWMPDMAFFDEPDDPKGVNNFLGVFTKAGEKPSEFKAIWD